MSWTRTSIPGSGSECHPLWVCRKRVITLSVSNYCLHFGFSTHNNSAVILSGLLPMSVLGDNTLGISKLILYSILRCRVSSFHCPCCQYVIGVSVIHQESGVGVPSSNSDQICFVYFALMSSKRHRSIYLELWVK